MNHCHTGQLLEICRLILCICNIARGALNILIKTSSSRFERVLTMVYNTENYWGFGLCPSSGILEIRKQNVLETAFHAVLR
jgi:hypothetical protein